MKELISWIFSPAGAGWVFGVVSLLALIITRGRDLRPRRVVVQELRRVEPISIRANLKDRIKITFDGNDVKSLGQIEASIFNEGKDTIKEPEISIEFPENIKVIDATVSESSANGIAEWAGNVAHLKFKFLNAKKEHRHIEKVSIITSGLIDRIKVTGGGEGWSVRHIHLPTAAEQRTASRRMLWSSIIFFVIMLADLLIARFLGIGMDEVSPRANMVVLPLAIAFAAWLVLILVQSKNTPTKN
jgi:hypothetical protein